MMPNKSARIFASLIGSVAIASPFADPPTPESNYPVGGLVQDENGNIYGVLRGSNTCSPECGAIFRLSPSKQVTVLYRFHGGRDGANPQAGLTKGADGRLYGTTTRSSEGLGSGTIFKIAQNAPLLTLYNFEYCSIDSYGSLVLGVDGALYGVDNCGGGTLFKISQSGAFSSIFSFGGNDSGGIRPYGGLVVEKNGYIYGTTSGFIRSNGGDVVWGEEGGVVFNLSPSGTINVMHTFHGATDGRPSGGLVRGSDGNLYGATKGDGAGFGTLYKITTSGMKTVLHVFAEGDGGPDSHAYGPNGEITLGSDGSIYGLTRRSNSLGVDNSNDLSKQCGERTCGTVFKLDPSGKFSILHSFSQEEGAPSGPLLYGEDGALYGVLGLGGKMSCGALFKVTQSGQYDVLHSFGNSPCKPSE